MDELMNIPEKLLIDVEKEKGAMSFGLISDYDKKVKIVFAGKQIVSISKKEQDLKIYKLLKENCDLLFCTTQESEDFNFYPVPMFSIFAYDSKGNCFGTIGGLGDFADDVYPVGFVNRDGMYGKLSNSLKEFFELLTFYPYWLDIFKYEQLDISYNINTIEIKEEEINSEYFESQREIAETLKLSKNQKSIELLLSNIKSKHEFIIYNSKEHAQMENTFWDMMTYTF